MKKRTWQSMCQCYLDGVITEAEFEWNVFATINQTNVAAFIDDCPFECLILALHALERLPTTDDGWAEQRIWGMEWCQKDSPPVLAACRQGVETFRTFLGWYDP